MQALLEEEDEGESLKVSLDKDIIIPAPKEINLNGTTPSADTKLIAAPQVQANVTVKKNISIPNIGTSTAQT